MGSWAPKKDRLSGSPAAPPPGARLDGGICKSEVPMVSPNALLNCVAFKYKERKESFALQVLRCFTGQCVVMGQLPD